MSKYIDAEKLKAEIERLNEEYNKSIPIKVPKDKMEATKMLLCMGKVEVLNKVLCVLDSLQQEQPEVDIEKEIEEHAENMPHGEFTHDSECVEHEEWAKKEFRHFYELGLNARKEE